MNNKITKESAERILFLMRLCHPKEHGEPYDRGEVMKEIERRGLDLLKDLGWGVERDHIYKNRYTGCETTLESQLNYTKISPLQLFAVLENWTPIEIWTDKDCFAKYKKKATLSGWL